jgi:Flp pilus assembly pilin Flp
MIAMCIGIVIVTAVTNMGQGVLDLFSRVHF